MDHLTLALDWTPNINHIGFFVAQELGFYHDHGVELKIVHPGMDHYALTPAKKVEKGLADLALCPTESIISYKTKNKPFHLIGIATIFQSDVSAIAVRKDSEIKSPRDLDGKIYASYKARYEDAIVREMIRNDRGEGDIITEYPEKLGVWDTLLMGAYDATWIFLNWEGVEAEMIEEPLTFFKLADYHIPYSYSPLIAASKDKTITDTELFRTFLKATKEGFAHCMLHREESIRILKPHIPFYDSKVNLEKAYEISRQHLGNADTWGHFKEESVEVFLQWLVDHDLESNKIPVSDIITNNLLMSTQPE